MRAPLRRGDGGEPVKDLQRRLNKLGSVLLIDGDFGIDTETAVVEDQEPMYGLIGERLPQLLKDPPSRRVRGHVEMKDPSACVVDREPDVEKVEADRRHDEEVHSRDPIPCDSARR